MNSSYVILSLDYALPVNQAIRSNHRAGVELLQYSDRTWTLTGRSEPRGDKKKTKSFLGRHGRPVEALLTFWQVMDAYEDLCVSFRLPVWIAPLLHAAKRLRSDHARRRKVYRLLQRKLMFHRMGVKEGSLHKPTYVYPEEVKMLTRSAFPEDVCDYPNPCHHQVVFVTVEDLHKVEVN